MLPIIDSLEMPFSRWVTEQLRRHAAQTAASFGQQVLADADLTGSDRRLTRRDALAAGERMDRSAPW